MNAVRYPLIVLGLATACGHASKTIGDSGTGTVSDTGTFGSGSTADSSYSFNCNFEIASFTEDCGDTGWIYSTSVDGFSLESAEVWVHGPNADDERWTMWVGDDRTMWTLPLQIGADTLQTRFDCTDEAEMTWLVIGYLGGGDCFDVCAAYGADPSYFSGQCDLDP